MTKKSQLDIKNPNQQKTNRLLKHVTTWTLNETPTQELFPLLVKIVNFAEEY